MLKKIFLVGIILCFVLVGGVQANAFSAWSSSNGCWTATNDTYTLVMWNTTGTSSWSVPSGVSNVTYLVVAGGGGGGGGPGGGGGGAGGMLESSLLVNKTVNVTVGAGGIGGLSGYLNGSSGQNSSFGNITVGDIVNANGGGGGTGTGIGKNGGSGGGSSGNTLFNGGNGTLGQGNDGGIGTGDGFTAGGGGGGKLEVGARGDGTRKGGNGGNSSINNSLVTYAGGGGGGTNVGSNSLGGLGGGGIGGFNAAGGNGIPNTGGGGGGSGTGFNGGNGGSGIVIIRYDIRVTSIFNTNSSKGITPLSVGFTDISTGYNTSSWNWSYITDINPSAIVFSNNQNPSYSFTTGNYFVSFNTSSITSFNISSQWVNVSSDIGNSVSYTNISNGLNQKNISFVGVFSLGDLYVQSWNWSFGDGNYSSLKSPLYSYPSDGYYTTTLTVTPYGGAGTTYSTSKLISIPQQLSTISNLVQSSQSNVNYLYNDSFKVFGTASVIGCITAMDVPELGSWVGISTSEPMIYHQQIVNTPVNGFGSVYSGTANFGTAADIATSDSAAFSTEGRGLFADIYLLDGTRKGTYTTGGTVRSVDVAVKNGLWAVSGGDDGKLYIYSKDATSAWYVFYQGDSDFPILSSAMSWKGEYVGAGRSNGKLEYYSTSGTSSSATAYMVNVFVSKGGAAYKNANINVTEGSTIATATTSTGSGLTDSYGKYSFSATDLKYYRINVNSGEYIFDYQATSSYTTVTINIPTALVTRPYQYASVFNDTSNIITTSYDDVNIADINITVTDMTNNTIIHMADYHSTTMTDQVLGDATHEYRINLKFTRTTGTTYQDTLYAKTSIFGKVTHIPDQWKLFEYAVYSLFLMFVALAIGTTSPKYGVILIPALVVLGVWMGFLPMSIWLVPLGLSAFIAMTEALRRRSD